MQGVNLEGMLDAPISQSDECFNTILQGSGIEEESFVTCVYPNLSLGI